jgi:hypothetical protein
MGFGNLGIALGAGVDEWSRQRANDRADKADLRAENADVRQQQQFDAQMGESKRLAAEREAATKVWSDAMPVFTGGWQFAAKHLADAYNSNDEGLGYNDGKSVDIQVHPNGVYVAPKNPDGSFGQPTFYKPDQIMHEHIRATKARLAAINPEYGERFVSWLDTQSKREDDRADRLGQKAYVANRDSVKDNQFERELEVKRQRNSVLEAQGNKPPRGLTPQQDRANLEIDAARAALAGMDPAEIKRKTANFTATGRENPDFDPNLSRAMKLAGRRKVGQDDHFDAQMPNRDNAEARSSLGSGTDLGGLSPGYSDGAPAVDRADVAKRFRADRSMDNYKLGRDTPQGVEVISGGKVIGHFQ